MERNVSKCIFLILIVYAANARSAELTFNPRLSVSTEAEKRDYKADSSQTANQQRVQLGFKIINRTQTVTQSFDGDIGLIDYKSTTNYSSVTRALSGNLSIKNKFGSVGFRLTSNKNNSYPDSIESISIRDSNYENTNASGAINISRMLTRKHSISANANYFTAITRRQNVKVIGSETYGIGVNFQYQPENQTVFSSGLQQSRVGYDDSVVRTKTTQMTVAGNRQLNARVDLGASVGLYVTEQDYGESVFQRGNTFSITMKYKASARSTLSLSGNKEVLTTDFGNFVNRKIIRSQMSYQLSKRSSVGIGFSYGNNEEGSLESNLASQNRKYFSLNLTSSQQLSREVTITQVLSYGSEEIASSGLSNNTNTWRANFQLQYFPRIIL